MSEKQHDDVSERRDTDEAALWSHLQGDEPLPEEELPTPQLTTSQAKRLKTPMVSMVLTMLVLSGILAALWFMNPEQDVTYTRDEDVPAAAEGVASVTDYDPVVPQVPEEWTANYARWDTRAEHSVQVWEVGWTTDSVHFVGFAQTDEANPAWVNEETERAEPTGTETRDGMTFEIRADDDRQYWVLEAEENTIDGTTLIIGGDAPEDEFDVALDAVISAIGEEEERD